MRKCVMIEIFNNAFHKHREPFEPAEDELVPGTAVSYARSSD
jgi:hypothetical protein